jgi:Molybdate transporter of MFS superfamily
MRTHRHFPDAQRVAARINEVPKQTHSPMSPANRFGRMEWAGAFGDFGTLLPFVVAYIAVVGLEPSGVLLAFGVALVASGLYYRTPFPVQPMKAIGAVAASQAAQTATITGSTVYAAALATGTIWLALGTSGAAQRIAALVPGCVVSGIVLGLGIAFMTEGIKLMSDGWAIAAIGLLASVLLTRNHRVPVMLLLLAFGLFCGALQHHDLLAALGHAQPAIHAPALALLSISWHDLLIGTTLLALPQVPLTLGNAVIAVTAENNRMFPDRQVTETQVATSTGIMNLFSATVGGVPMCHGAAGMAGHVAFGAKTGGAPMIIGVLLILLSVFFSDSVVLAFQLFAHPVLGVMLLMSGAQLALGANTFSSDRTERFITLVVAAFSIWNVGVAFVIGMALIYLSRRSWLSV